MDKYIEKMVLVPEERWNQLLRNENHQLEEDQGGDSEIDHPFPIEKIKDDVKNNVDGDVNDFVTKVKEGEKDKQLAPPGIPEEGINDIESIGSEGEHLPLKKQRKHKHSFKTVKHFQWKNLP